MEPSTSVQKHQNDRKPKKKHRKFKSSQDGSLKSDEKLENEDVNAKKNESEGKSFNKFEDLKEFPQLRSFGNQNSTFEFKSNSKSNTLQNDKSWLSALTNEKKKKPSEPFPALSKNFKKNEISLSTKKDLITQTVSENESSVVKNVETEVPVNPNIKENKVSLKKTAVQPQRNPNKKKRSDSIFINFQDVLTINKIQKKRKQLNFRSKNLRFKQKELLSGNILDSSNPKRNRGKHREIKKKKLSKFKMTIIKERILKSKIREKTLDGHLGSNSVYLLDNIDFNEEIKIYQNELKKKKLQNSENTKNKVNKKIVKNLNEETQGIIEINNEETKIKEKTKCVEKTEENFKNISDSKKKDISQVTFEGEVKFSSKFREYCDNIIMPELNSAVSEFIKELIKLQDKLFLRDPIKAKIRKRHVSGIREVKKYLVLKKVKLIIIAPNLEKLQMEGSIFDSISELKSMADSQNVPYGFALDRYKLGKCTKKNTPVSAFAVLNYEGIEALHKDVMHQLLEAKKKFSELTKPKLVENDVNSKVISTLISTFKDVISSPGCTNYKFLSDIRTHLSKNQLQTSQKALKKALSCGARSGESKNLLFRVFTSNK